MKVQFFWLEIHELLLMIMTIILLKPLENRGIALRAGITYPIFADTYITDLYFSVYSIYCIYFFEPENFFCK